MPEQMEQTPQPPQAQQAQPVGMSETATCGLAYLTFIPAIIFLATAPYNQNPKVRFHAWQSIFLAIGWVCIAVVATVLMAIPILGFLIDTVVWLAFVALWLVVMINAFMGKTIKVPVIAPLAAKQAGYTL
ncbi:MAG TPA: hypothetical protein VGL22_07715 [Terracidiphilus sp.]|jgi:uncharacterized membrane protein